MFVKVFVKGVVYGKTRPKNKRTWVRRTGIRNLKRS
jgi:hypothetical protein